MANKLTTWTDETHGIVEILDGPVAGKYPFDIWAVRDGALTLGEVIYEGKPRMLKVKTSEVIGFADHYDAWRATIANQPIHCERCGKEVTKSDYHQLEWFRAGGLKAKVETYYCKGCAHLLQSIGAGEHTEMQERSGHVPSYEPTYKSDY
jgi:hypothetical protein